MFSNIQQDSFFQLYTLLHKKQQLETECAAKHKQYQEICQLEEELRKRKLRLEIEMYQPFRALEHFKIFANPTTKLVPNIDAAINILTTHNLKLATKDPNDVIGMDILEPHMRNMFVSQTWPLAMAVVAYDLLKHKVLIDDSYQSQINWTKCQESTCDFCMFEPENKEFFVVPLFEIEFT